MSEAIDVLVPTIELSETIYEGETAWLKVSFYDRNGNLTTPSTITYTLFDLDSRAIINNREDTTVAVGTTVEIELTPDDNVIVDRLKIEETACVLIQATYDGGKIAKELISYPKYNLPTVT